MEFPFAKGHGTENDFVLLPDPAGTVHGRLSAATVAALCDRRAGIGGDGVLRVIRTEAIAPELADQAEWFMDYRNADGSLSEMCGNGIRVFFAYLLSHGLTGSGPVPVATRDGIKTLTRQRDGQISVGLGVPRVLTETTVTVASRELGAREVDMGNPHAVAFIDDLAAAGTLTTPPGHDPIRYPAGVNVEFVVREGAGRLAMRVHERGAGETRSCGTGAAAAAAAAIAADGLLGEHGLPQAPAGYRVRVPGGVLELLWSETEGMVLTGPAVLVAEGTAHV